MTKQTKRYEVVGNHPIDGHKPGDEFSADYTDGKERFLVAAGHIKVKKGKEKSDGKADR